ncbi:hypothetical protein V6Z11_D11G234600 [Gossypium hirsutum]|uniref:DUF7745 domain-containing protein n=1 Tax=Gossypium hirsutum TaxID=3635 RepID=A0A1U8JW86_GOSHI|nr:uncharacterized protein LOC107911136 [Gossypium hirsutum]
MYLLDIKVDEQLFRALAQYWNPAYSCFTFGKEDLVPTVEEYTTLLHCPRLQVDKAYSKAAYVPTLWKKLMTITGTSEQWITARIKQKCECKCIPWRNLRDLILAHPDGKRKVDVFALSIYGLVIFPRALGHVDEAVSDLFDRLGKEVTPVPEILAEMFRSLNACRRAGEGRFTGCAQLLIDWFHSHFWKVDKVSYRVFFRHYSPLKEIVATPRRDDISEENWIAILFDWVLLLGIWGAVGYAPLLALKQYNSRHFVPVTYGLAQCEFLYRGDNYKKKVKEISQAWNQVHRMKRLAVGSMTTLEYGELQRKRINYNITELNLESVRPMEEYLQVIPLELEIIKQDFEKRNLGLERKIERLEEEKMHLRLDVDVQKLEAEKLKKGKNKVDGDLDSLKTDYKRLRVSMRTAGLGKTSEQWRQKIQEESNKADRWERKSRETQVLKETLEWQVLETQNYQADLKARIAKLERSFATYRSRNSVVELKTSLCKIEEMKKRIEELEYPLQGCRQQIESLEGNKERWRQQLHHS